MEVAKEAGVKRLLIVGGAGTLFCAPGLRVVDSGVIPVEIMDGVKSLGEFYLDILTKENDIDWVFFSPAGAFVEGTRTGKYRLGKDDLIVDDKGKVPYPWPTMQRLWWMSSKCPLIIRSVSRLDIDYPATQIKQVPVGNTLRRRTCL